MPPARDLTGQKFNSLTALYRDGVSSRGHILWRFACICGTEIIHSGATVSKGEKISCGCHKEQKKVTPRVCDYCGGESVKLNEAGYVGNICHRCAAVRMKQYLVDNPTYYLVAAARSRAKKMGMPFNITPEDVSIPEFCPVLGIRLIRGKMGDRDHSPSIDKIIPELGYTKGNVAIMSFRANRFKNDATIEELKKVVEWYEANIPKIQSVNTNFQESIQ